MAAEEEEIYCSKCNSRTNQTLVLICDHQLCMNCAAENIILQEKPGVNDQFVICDLCGAKTNIDTNTSKEILSSVLNSNNNNNNFNENDLNKNNFDENKFNEKNLNSNSLNFVNSSFNNNENIILNKDYDNISTNSKVCKEHGEPITYLCFDCMSQCICSECVVHGIHKNHEVLNLKKAYPIIFDKTQEIGNLLNIKINDLGIMQQTINQQKNEIEKLKNKCKNDISIAFEQLRQKLNNKEKEALIKTDTILNDNISELNTYNHIVQSKIILFKKMIDTISTYLMRKDELALINFYRENKNKYLSQSELTEINNLPNLDTFSKFQISIDKSSFDAIISAINTFNLEIDNLKKNQKYDIAKFTAMRNLYGMRGVENSLDNVGALTDVNYSYSLQNNSSWNIGGLNNSIP